MKYVERIGIVPVIAHTEMGLVNMKTDYAEKT